MRRDFIRKAKEMLLENRRRRGWQALAVVAGAVVAVVCAVSLMFPAHALTGGDSLRSAITDDSAVYYKAADAADDAWQKADASTPIAADSSLRLRIAFTLPAGTLANGTVLQYQLPDGVKLAASRGTVTGDLLSGATVADPTNQDATTIGSYEAKDGILTVTFNEDVATENAGKPADASTSADASGSSSSATDTTNADATQAQEGKELSAYVDLDLGFDELATDSDGLATIQLNDSVKLQVTKAAEKSEETAAASDSASDGSASSSSSDSSSSATGAASAKTLSVRSMAKSSGNTNGTVSTNSVNSTIDLTSYITSAEVKKVVNGSWTDATEFNDGDSVKVAISYKLPKGTLTSSSKVVTYQLPDGIKPNEASSGDIMNGSTKVGTYTIDANGLATLTFNDDFAADGGAVSGTLNFTGKVSNSSTSDDKTIHFGGDAKDITIKKKDESKEDTTHDISVKKTATLSSDRKTISYTVEASTSKGTNGTVTITDKLDKWNTSNAAPQYNKSSFVVTKVAADNTQTTVSLSDSNFTLDNTSTDSNGGPNFTIKDLPALSAGEKYVVTYTAAVNATDGAEQVKVPNNASAKDENNNSGGDSQDVEWVKDIQKSGYYDASSGKIHWTITVNRNKVDLSKWEVKDSIPNGLKLTGPYTVKSNDGSFNQSYGAAGDTSFDVKFSDLGLTDAQKTQQFTIDFYTDAPSSNGTVSNTATSTDGSGKTTSGTGTADVEHRTLDVSKKHTTESFDSDTLATERWQSTITLPEGNLTSFTYTDTVANAKDASGTDMGNDSHYATASELEQAFASVIVNNQLNTAGGLKIKVDDNTYYYYAGYAQSGAYLQSNNDSSKNGTTQDVCFKVTYYDADGNEVSATDTKTHVKSFKVAVTVKDNTSIQAKSMETGTYVTHVNHANAKEGTNWTISNTGAVGDKTSTADYTFGNPKKLDKQVQDPDGKGNKPYKSDSATVDYDQVSGVLSYRLLLSTTEADSGKDIVITDTLPDGATLVDGSVSAYFFANEYYQPTTNYGGTDFTGAQKPQVTTSTVDGKTVMTITIPNYAYHDNDQNQFSHIAIYYKLSVKDDPSWNSSMSKTYSNTASWGTHSATSDTIVKREATKIAKSGEQLDKNGNAVTIGSDGKPTVTPSGKVRYYIELNTGAENLDANSDELVLTDTLTCNSAFEPKLDPNSLKLYAYDVTKAHHYDSTKEIKNFRVKYDESTHKLTVTIPDETACVLVYDYQLNDNFTDNTTISNSAQLSGKYSSSSSVNLKEVSSSATAQKAKLVIYKVDEDDFHTTLRDATFELYYWDGSSNSWKKKDTKSKLTTDANGAITYDLEENVDGLQTNTLYRLKETKAPYGYESGAVRYFIWRDTATSDNGAAFSAANASNAKDDSGNAIQQSSVEFFSHSGGNVYVTDKYTRVSVQKNWANDDGTAATAPSGATVELQLYRSTKKIDTSDAVKVTVTGEGNTGASTSKLDGSSDGVRYVKKGSNFMFQLSGYNGQTYTVYIDGVSKYTGKIDGNNTPVPITLSNLTSDVTVDVKSGDYNAFSLTSKSWQDPKQILDGSSKTAVGDSVTVSATDNWAHNWDNLAQEDNNGNKYYYTVQELGYTVDGTYYDASASGKYTVSYSNNAGIQTGSITVTNSMPKSYELPKTGGSGTGGITLLGVTVAIASAGALLARRARKGKGTE